VAQKQSTLGRPWNIPEYLPLGKAAAGKTFEAMRRMDLGGQRVIQRHGIDNDLFLRSYLPANHLLLSGSRRVLVTLKANPY
jgi:hypothetical protein